ncbi:MAG: TonB-dependent receptor domain-containing protein [Thermaurantimonas sp.]
MRRILLSAGLLPHLLALNAQVHPLPVVEVSAPRIHLNAFGLMDYSPDSLLWHHRNLFEISGILQYALPATIRQYGPGLIATIRVRGLGSEHFKVIWNGLSLNNPALGSFDMSGVHAGTFSQIQVLQGNVAGFYGSGSGGGALLLSSHPSEKAFGLSTHAASGSFGYRQFGVQTEYSSGKTSVKIASNQHLSRNDYTFTNLSLQPQRLANGSYLHHNLNLDIGYEVIDNQSIHLAVWNQSSFINIPPSRVESRFNTARQWNDNFRSVISYTRSSEKLNLIGGLGWVDERMVYHNDVLQSADTHYVTSVQSFLRGMVPLRKGRILFNTEAAHAEAPSSHRSADAMQTHLLLNATYESWFSNNLLYAVTIRQEWMDGSRSVPIAKISGKWLRTSFAVHTSLGNHFRWPTLNEKYWIPGGNTDLKAESGFTADAGFRHRKNFKGWLVNTEFQPFVQWIDQLIVWQPISGIWSPINIQNVRSQGTEALYEIQKNIRAIHSFRARFSYCYNKTLVTDAQAPMDISIGNELIYAPVHSGNGLVGYSLKRWTLMLTTQFQSAQHTLFDNHPSGLLQGFIIFNAFIFREIHFRQAEAKVGFEIRNMTDREYQMIAQRPMPGREFRIQVQIQYIKPKTNKL